MVQSLFQNQTEARASTPEKAGYFLDYALAKRKKVAFSSVLCGATTATKMESVLEFALAERKVVIFIKSFAQCKNGFVLVWC
jgi:hypothetical protein